MKSWIEDAKQAILESSQSSSIYIGCDSLRKKIGGKQFAKYSTVIIVHKDSCHGCQVFPNSVMLPDYAGLKERLLTEVGYAIEAATEILDIIGDRHLEVHLDINPDPKHKSHVAVKEATGWVLGMGLKPVLKPEAFAATHGADSWVRNH